MQKLKPNQYGTGVYKACSVRLRCVAKLLLLGDLTCPQQLAFGNPPRRLLKGLGGNREPWRDSQSAIEASASRIQKERYAEQSVFSRTLQFLIAGFCAWFIATEATQMKRTGPSPAVQVVDFLWPNTVRSSSLDR